VGGHRRLEEVPVVVSEARGSRELVGADRSIVVTTADVATLAQAMDRLLDHPSGGARWAGAAGRRWWRATTSGPRSAGMRRSTRPCSWSAAGRSIDRPAVRRDPGRRSGAFIALEELRADGLVTDDEYHRKRVELLDRL
jgi:hypothetical protein